MSNFTEILAAAERAKGHICMTPFLNAPDLDQIAGRRVFIKAENLQHTGSFKARGGWAAVSALTQTQKAQGVLALSSGNHAQGVARAARAEEKRARAGAPTKPHVMHAYARDRDDARPPNEHFAHEPNRTLR